MEKTRANGGVAMIDQTAAAPRASVASLGAEKQFGGGGARF